MANYRSGNYYRPSFFGGFGFFPPVIKWLLISNVAILFIVGILLRPFTIAGMQLGGDGGLFMSLLALWPPGTNFWPWQLLTYMFLHGGLGHLFFNMLALWMFGMELENTWGSKKFLIYYMLCGVGAGVANSLVAMMLGQTWPTVGASGAVFGVLIAFGMLFPERPIYLYFLLPVRAKYFIAVYIAMELFYGVSGTSDGIAHFAHLGGAAVGLIYMLVDMRTIPGKDLLQQLRGEIKNPFASTAPPPNREIYDAKFFDIRSGRSLDDETAVSQEIIDEILDKISTGGYQNLTDEEKRMLNEASRKIH